MLPTFPTSLERLQVIRQLIQNGYAIIDNFLTDPNDLQSLVAECSTAASYSSDSSILLKTDQPEHVRQDLTYDVDPLDGEKLPYLARASRTLQFVVGGAVDAFVPQQLYTRERPQFACYNGDGAFYTRHYDNPRMLDGGVDNLRRVTILLYVNEDWDEAKYGGQLRLHLKSQSTYDVTVAPLANRCVIFFSDLIEHEVLPSHGGKKKRLALTVWLSEFVADSAFDLATRVDSKDQLMRDYFVACCGLCS